ncbi:MAG: heavy-metal-associated domain-containing protein [Alphaproteobacteria bacterium]
MTLFVALNLGLPSSSFASPRIVTLSVENMYCAACPFIVKETLSAVPGVTDVAVNFEAKTATVSFDDAVAGIDDLTTATGEAGYPAHEAQP